MRSALLISIASSLGLGTVLVTGCIPQGGVGGPARGVGNASVLATVEGIDKQDRENDKMTFWLKCRSGTQIQGEGKTGDVIKFADASKVSATDSCWLELRLTEAEGIALDYQW